MERLFALPAAGLSLAGEAGLEAAGRGGVCLKAVDSGEFASVETDLRGLVDLAAHDAQGEVAVQGDEYGYRWIVFSEPDLGDLVNLVHLVGSTLQEKGYGEQLLAALFRFKAATQGVAEGRPFYLVYHYKRGSFYPFAPAAQREERDEALEFRVSSVLSRELPIEKDQSRWFPLWDCPV